MAKFFVTVKGCQAQTCEVSFEIAAVDQEDALEAALAICRNGKLDTEDTIVFTGAASEIVWEEAEIAE